MFSPVIKITPVVEKTTTKNSSKKTSNTTILNNEGVKITDVHRKENPDLLVLNDPVLPNSSSNFTQPDLAPKINKQQSSNQQLSDETRRPNDSQVRPNNMNASCSQLNRNLIRNHIRFENVCNYDLYPEINNKNQ